MSLKLLFADDSVTMHKVVQLALESEDIDLRIASDGKEALSAVGEDKPDVLIADIAMPIMNGFELCRQIKQSVETKDIPVVLLSGELEEYDEELGATVGADAHITKPFKSGEFIDTVRNLTLGDAAAGKIFVQSGVGLAAENDLEEEAGMLYEEKATNGGVAGSEQDALLELTPTQSAESGAAPLPDMEFDEEFEVVSDDTEIEDALDDDDDDLLSDGLDIDGVDMELEGLEEAVEEASEETPASDAESLPADDQSVDNDIDSVFAGLSGDAEEDSETAMETDELVAEEPPVESLLEADENMAAPVESTATEAEKADEILDEVFKDTDIESLDEQLTEAGEADAEEEFVFDTSEAEAVEVVGGEVAAEEEIAEIAESPAAEPGPLSAAEPASAEVVETAAVKAEPLSAADLSDAVRDSVEKTVRDFMENNAADIFREELAKTLDARLSAFLDAQLETIVKQEMSGVIGKQIESAMPEIVAAAARVTSEVTPKIAEELIKKAIEQIKKGDAA